MTIIIVVWQRSVRGAGDWLQPPDRHVERAVVRGGDRLRGRPPIHRRRPLDQPPPRSPARGVPGDRW